MDTPAPPLPLPQTPHMPASDADYWARRVERLTVGDLPANARNLNVDGRRVTSPVQGFGKMWQKTYRIRLEGSDASPEEVIATWRARFNEFWPKRNWFFGSLDGIKPGDVAVLQLSMLGMPITTGVLVLYADDTTFTVMTPEGHQFAGFNTFSAHRDGEVTCIQIQALIRASDPLYELALPIVGHRMEDRFWRYTLRALAAEFGVAGHDVSLERTCIDPRRQWRRWTNVWNNAAIRSILWLLATPLRWLVKPFRRERTATHQQGPVLREQAGPPVAQPSQQTAGPQAPVLVVGRHGPFLDVQPTLHAAVDHLAREHLSGDMQLDACDYFDGLARPLQPVLDDDGALSLVLAQGDPQPDVLRDRVNRLLGSTLQTYVSSTLPFDSQVEEAALEPIPEAYTFARFVDELDARFNRPPLQPRHVAGRLHNFWHALGGG